MLRERIELNSDSDPSRILDMLNRKCAAAGLSPQDTEKVITEVSAPLTALIESGRAVASSRGQFRASREIVTESATVLLDARFGMRKGLLTRLADALRGQRA